MTCNALRLAVDVLGYQVDWEPMRKIEHGSPLSRYGGGLSVHKHTYFEHPFMLRTHTGAALHHDVYSRGEQVPEPTKYDAFAALVLDASLGMDWDEDDYDDWASEKGYDPDSLSGYRIFQACRRTYDDLKGLPTLQVLIDHINNCEVCP